MKEYQLGNWIVHSFAEGEIDHTLSEEDHEMDRCAKEAVRAAIAKAKFLGQPIAKYDKETKRAYVEYADGRREYV